MRTGGFRLFFAFDWDAVARTIWLDGYTFRDSHSVNKKLPDAAFNGGIEMIIHCLRITYSYLNCTKELETHQDEQNFG